jgi:hypothetical protein
MAQSKTEYDSFDAWASTKDAERAQKRRAEMESKAADEMQHERDVHLAEAAFSWWTQVKALQERAGMVSLDSPRAPLILSFTTSRSPLAGFRSFWVS